MIPRLETEQLTSTLAVLKNANPHMACRHSLAWKKSIEILGVRLGDEDCTPDDPRPK